jgi:hypothetical protein
MAAEADQFEEDHSTTKGNCKTGLTLTGLLMEGLGVRKRNLQWAPTKRSTHSGEE